MSRALAAHAASTPPAPGAPACDRGFLSLRRFSPERLEQVLDLAARMKRDRVMGPCAPTATALSGQHVAMLFDKPSLRTRTTFEVAIRELGGTPIVLPAEVALGEREPVADVARNLERWVHAVVIRTFAQRIVEDFATAAPRLAVINALTDEEHPCQALADLLTMREHLGPLAGQTIAYVGDGNNVATSLVHGAVMLGTTVHVASPTAYTLPPAVVSQAARLARHGASVRLFTDPREAVGGASAIYTDVWTSMGQESESAHRRRIFAPYQVNRELMAAARAAARFMHCLPAHRGDEVTNDVFDSEASVVFDQAENRLHTQKALLLHLLHPTAQGSALAI
jgi:ornithine carbamoyltransferase